MRVIALRAEGTVGEGTEEGVMVVDTAAVVEVELVAKPATPAADTVI